MKRFFAIIISICMLFCFMPTTAFADDIGGSLEETETQGIEVNEPEGEEQNIEGEEQNGENPIRIISDNAEENNPNEAHFNVSQPLDSDVNTVKLAFPKEFESISIVKITEDGLDGDDRIPESEVVMDLRDDIEDNDLNDIFELSEVEPGEEENTVNLNLLKIPNHAWHYITFELKTEGGHVQECEISTCVDIDISIKAASDVPEDILNEVSVKLHFTEFSEAIKKAYDEGAYAEKELFGARLVQENEDKQLNFSEKNGIRAATQKALGNINSDIKIGGSVILSTNVPDGYVIDKITDIDGSPLLWQAEIQSLFLLKNSASERLSNLDIYKFIDSERGCPGNNSTSVSFDRDKMEVIQNSELYKYMKENHGHDEVSNIPFSMPAARQGIAYNLPEDMKGEKCSETETYEEYFKGFYEENMTDLINACGDEYKTELRHSATVYSINVPTDKKTGVVIHIKKLEDKAAEDITASGNDKVQLKHEEVVNNAEAETAKNTTTR